MSFPRPGFFRRLAAALLMGLPLVPACVVLGPVFGFLLVLGFYCWAFFIWDHMRLLRQRELAAGLRLALASGVPLERVLGSGPERGGARGWLETTGLWFVPFPLYWLVWERQFGHGALQARARGMLLSGHGPEVLSMPGLLARDDLFELRICQGAPRWIAPPREDSSLTPRLLAQVPGLLYPLVMMTLLVIITLFWSIFIAPKIARIFQEFGLPLPWLTLLVLDSSSVVMSWLLPAMLVVTGILAMAYYETPLRWWMPGLRGIFAPHGRGMILAALGDLTARSMPLEEAIHWLLEGNATDGTGRRMLSQLALAVAKGLEPARAMAQAGLVNTPEAAWLATTVASGRFPAALVELGQSLQTLAIRRLERRVILTGTIGTVAVGLVVGTTVLAIFIPLIDLIGWLTP